ncbi:MAG: hypothetical protein LBH28_10145 [Oscillospiraceae bacterium]|jgi:hypothetical protein|nr:hypothetical protein [Oscillospiraceae bacterium]
MLGKLMKYEFKATGRIFLPLFAALLILSAVNRLLLALGLQTPANVGIGVAGILVVGICVLAFVLTLQRFRHNLLSSEGYLMMTLPTSVDSLILSKVITAVVWILASFAVVIVSVLIMASTANSWKVISDAVDYIRNHLSLSAGQITIYIIEAFVAAILGIFSGIQLIYACMSLSMLVNKRRGLFAFGAFIVITTAMQIISSILIVIGVALNIFGAFGNMSNGLSVTLNGTSIFGQTQIAILLGLLVEAVTYVIFYAITRYMLKNRLNLQ